MTRKATSQRLLKKRTNEIFKKEKTEKTSSEIDEYVKVLNPAGKTVKVIKNNEKYI